MGIWTAPEARGQGVPTEQAGAWRRTRGRSRAPAPLPHPAAGDIG
jgi:hypothetical protein